MPDRRTQPPFQVVSEFNMLKADKRNTTNGLEIYTFYVENQDILKIEFIIEAGSVFDKNPLTADMTNAMLNEGTHTRSSAQIADEIEYFGAYLSLNLGKHFAYITLFSLKKYLHKALPVIEDILRNANFPEKEFEIVKMSQFQDFMVSRQRTRDLAGDAFNEHLFGTEHPYGRSVRESDFDEINTNTLQAYHHRFYKSSKPRVIISGAFTEEHINLIDSHFGDLIHSSHLPEINFDFSFNEQGKTVYLPKKDSVQSTIIMGYPTILKSHPDFIPLNIASMILGGYFGSRLMKNIREDKGYTYGIYSGLSAYRHAGMFEIEAETGIDVTEKAVKEIHKELRKMQNDLVQTEELERVRNYMSASFLRRFDGVLAASDAFRALLLSDLEYSYYENYFKILKNISAEEIREISQRYFSPELMVTVIAGKSE